MPVRGGVPLCPSKSLSSHHSLHNSTANGFFSLSLLYKIEKKSQSFITSCHTIYTRRRYQIVAARHPSERTSIQHNNNNNHHHQFLDFHPIPYRIVVVSIIQEAQVYPSIHPSIIIIISCLALFPGQHKSNKLTVSITTHTWCTFFFLKQRNLKSNFFFFFFPHDCERNVLLEKKCFHWRPCRG